MIRKAFLSMVIVLLTGTTGTNNMQLRSQSIASNLIPLPSTDYKDIFNEIDSGICDEMPSFEIFSIALKGFNNLKSKTGLKKDIISIIDFSKSSCEKRLWVIDLENRKVLFNELVAHGRNSGDNFATKFSNDPNTNMSSLGFYVTGETYTGKHGLSLYINGMDRDYNNNARDRAIVIHGADYVSQDFVKQHGRLGRSFGCPSLSTDMCKNIIYTISDGSCLFIYYPDKEFLEKSSVLNG